MNSYLDYRSNKKHTKVSVFESVLLKMLREKKRLSKIKDTNYSQIKPPPNLPKFQFLHTRHLRFHPLIQLPGPQFSFSCKIKPLSLKNFKR